MKRLAIAGVMALAIGCSEQPMEPDNSTAPQFLQFTPVGFVQFLNPSLRNFVFTLGETVEIRAVHIGRAPELQISVRLETSEGSGDEIELLTTQRGSLVTADWTPTQPGTYTVIVRGAVSPIGFIAIIS